MAAANGVRGAAQGDVRDEDNVFHGHVLPRHSPRQEQTGYLVSGHIALTIGVETRDVTPGDSWRIAGGVEHGAEVLQDSMAVEVLSAVREDHLPAARARPTRR